MNIQYSTLDDGSIQWEVVEDRRVLARGSSKDKKTAMKTAASFYRFIDRRRQRKWAQRY